MADPETSHSFRLQFKADTVIADAQPEFGRLNILKALHVALAGGGEVGQGVEKAQGGRLVDGAELGPGLVPPGDLLAIHAHCPG